MTEWELVTEVRDALTPEVYGELVQSRRISRSTVDKFKRELIPEIRLTHYLVIVQATGHDLIVDDKIIASDDDFGNMLHDLFLKKGTTVRAWVRGAKYKHTASAISRWCCGSRSPLLADAHQLIEKLGSSMRVEKAK